MLGFSYQENDGSVQQEGNQSVGNQSHDTQTVDVVHGHAGQISEQSDNTVGNGTGRGVVVEGNQRVHLELGRAQKALDHDQTQSLEDDTEDLDDETKTIELDFTEGGNDDTNDNDGDVAEGLVVSRGNTERPSSNQGHDGVGGLGG